MSPKNVELVQNILVNTVQNVAKDTTNDIWYKKVGFGFINAIPQVVQIEMNDIKNFLFKKMLGSDVINVTPETAKQNL